MAGGLQQPFRSWWTVRRLVAAGLVLGISVFGLAALFLLYVATETRNRELDRAELMSRVLARQANVTLSLNAANLEALSRDAIERATVREYRAISPALSRMLENRPELRSVSLVDAQGMVLASSSPDNLGAVLPAATLLSLSATAGKFRPAPLMTGRDLRTMEPPSPGRPMLPVLPVLQLIGEVNGQALYLVLLVNLDYLANQFEATLAETDSRVALVGFDGKLLSATSNLATEPGITLRGIDVFSRFLPTRESGRYVGAGIAGDRVLTAFAPLRHWPLLVIVEIPYARVTQPVTRSALFAATVVALLLGATATVTVPAARSLRRHQKMQRRFDEANRSARASDLRNQAILRSALDGILTVDSRGNVVAFNPAAEQIFGRELSAVLGRPMAELIIPETMRAQHHNGFARSLATRTSTRLNQRLEMPALHADGHEFPIEMTMTSLDVEGERFFTATVRDITALKRNAIEKAELLSTYRALASELEGQKFALDQHAIVSVADRDLKITYANAKLIEMSGYSRDELLGTPQFSQGVFARGGDHHAMRRALSLGKTWHGQWTNLRRDGSPYWVECTVVPLKDSQGQIREFISIQTDVTRRRQIELALQASEARFRATFEQAAVGLMHQAPGRRFIMVNHALCDMLGYTEAELLALPADQLIHPDDVRVGLDGMRQLLVGELASFRQNKRYRRKDGAYLWVRLTASVARDDHGALQYMIGVVENIDDYLRTQVELAAARARELEIGARIQQGLLVAPPPPELEGLWASNYSQASGGIDGDFVDVIRISEHVVDVLSGDVMGKGVPAALLGAATKLQFSRSLAELLSRRALGEDVPEPRTIVEAVNRAMAPHLQALEAFVTLTYLRIDTRADTLTWVGCGHEETLLMPAGCKYRTLANQQPPIGIFLDMEFSQDRCALVPGDGVFLCSDGVTESIHKSGERLGTHRLHPHVAQRMRQIGTPTMVLQALRHDSQNLRFQDDVTAVMLVRHDLHRQVHRIELPVTLASLPALRQFVQRHAVAAGPTEEAASNFTVAAVEVFTNILRHGRELLDGALVEAVIELANGSVVLQLHHVGAPFEPPAEWPEADLAAFPEGGFGLYIIQNACDDVSYRHQGDVNTVRLALQVRTPIQPV